MNMRIADHQDYKNVLEAKNIEGNFEQHFEPNETLCQACGGHLSSTLENVGFEGNQKLETEYFCSNGCEQDERVVIL